MKVNLTSLREKLKNLNNRPSTPGSPTRALTESSARLPTINRRSTSSEPHNEESPLARDVSYRHESVVKRLSNHEFRKGVLNEVLGMKDTERQMNLPVNLEEVEKEMVRFKDTFSDIENSVDLIKPVIEHTKFSETVIKDIEILYKTKFATLQSDINKIYGRAALSPRTNQSVSPIKSIERTTSERQLLRSDISLGAPSGRREVELLHYWLDYMIDMHITKITDRTLDQKIKAYQLIYTYCFNELIRQVSVHCLERGQLLEKIWNALLELFIKKDNSVSNRIDLTLKEFNEITTQNKQKFDDMLEKQQVKQQEMQKVIDEKNESIDLLNEDVKHHKEKVEMYQKRILELSESLSQTVKSNRMLFQQCRDLESYVAIERKEEFASPLTSSSEEESEDQHEKSTKLDEKIKGTRSKLYKPMILVGYFDIMGRFHRKQQFLREDDGALYVQDFSSEFAQIVDIKDKATSTYEDIDIIVLKDASGVSDIKHYTNPNILKFLVGLFSLSSSGKAKYSNHKYTQTTSDSGRKTLCKADSFDFKAKPEIIEPKAETKPSLEELESLGLIASIGCQIIDLDSTPSPKKERSIKKASTLIKKNRSKLKAIYKFEGKLLGDYFKRSNTVLKESQEITTEESPMIKDSSSIKDVSILLKEVRTSPPRPRANQESTTAVRNRSNTVGHKPLQIPKITNDSHMEPKSATLMPSLIYQQKSLDIIEAKPIENDDILKKINEDSFAAKILKRIKKLTQTLYQDIRDQKFNPVINWNEKTTQQAHKLRALLDNLYPVQKLQQSSPAEPTKVFHAYAQTDVTNQNIFIENMFKDFGFDSEIIEGSIIQQPLVKSRTMAQLKEKELSPQKSVEFSSPFKINRETKAKTNHATIAQNYILGQIKRRVVITHPGQYLLNKVMSSLITDNIPRNLSIENLMKIINRVYAAKVSLARENSIHKRHEASMVLHDVLINKYGLKDVAKKKFQQVVLASLVYKKHERVENFLRFLGIEKCYSVDD